MFEGVLAVLAAKIVFRGLNKGKLPLYFDFSQSGRTITKKGKFQNFAGGLRLPHGGPYIGGLKIDQNLENAENSGHSRSAKHISLAALVGELRAKQCQEYLPEHEIYSAPPSCAYVKYC